MSKSAIDTGNRNISIAKANVIDVLIERDKTRNKRREQNCLEKKLKIIFAFDKKITQQGYDIEVKDADNLRNTKTG